MSHRIKPKVYNHHGQQEADFHGLDVSCYQKGSHLEGAMRHMLFWFYNSLSNCCAFGLSPFKENQVRPGMEQFACLKCLRELC